jgi:hypothetical protein
MDRLFRMSRYHPNIRRICLFQDLLPLMGRPISHRETLSENNFQVLVPMRPIRAQIETPTATQRFRMKVAILVRLAAFDFCSVFRTRLTNGVQPVQRERFALSANYSASSGSKQSTIDGSTVEELFNFHSESWFQPARTRRRSIGTLWRIWHAWERQSSERCTTCRIKSERCPGDQHEFYRGQVGASWTEESQGSG